MVVLSKKIESINERALFRGRLITTKKSEFEVVKMEEIFQKYIPTQKYKRTRIEDLILKESNFQVLKYILSHLDLRRINKVLLSDSQDLSSAKLLDNVKYLVHTNNVRALVDFKKLNKVKGLNEYLSGIRKILPMAGIYIGCVETHLQRNRRYFSEKNKLLARFLIAYEFFFYRLLPKIRTFRKLFDKFELRKLPVLSLAETLGRLVYNGFDIIEFKSIRNLTFFVVMKTREHDQLHAGHDPIKQQILSENKYGNRYDKFKLTKYHSYSEYLPDYILHLNGERPSNRIRRDFRYNVIGRILYGTWKQNLLNYLRYSSLYIQEIYKKIRRITILPKIDLEDIFYIKNSLGKGGKLIRIYKFRTMIRNADHMDNIVVKYNSYGNPVDDPRITKLGRFMRKVWIDELPQLYSLIKRDIKLVGIRPMRESDWKRYPVELKEKALCYKPGLMGVQYGTLVKNDFTEHINFIKSYLDEKEKSPFRTDVQLFFRILYYIFFKGVRSD